MMEEVSLLSLPEGMRVEHIQITGEGLVIAIDASGFFPHLLLDCRGSNQIKDILSRSRRTTTTVQRGATTRPRRQSLHSRPRGFRCPRALRWQPSARV